MTECPDENLVVQLAAGGLADSVRVEIERHLDECTTCGALLETLAQLVAPVRAAPARYRMIAQLGAGAMGEVWEAEDLQLGRRVALKFINPDKTHDADRRNRLLREARALAQVRHANVVAVHDIGSMGSDDELYVALELVDGGNARQWRAAGNRTANEVLALWQQAAAGLIAVHAAGLVHRDVKPDNVLVASDGRVLLGDFGLARGSSNPLLETLTHSDVSVGTPHYMASEQLAGEAATAHSDQFAWCVSVWEALYGARPFVGKTSGALVLAMQQPPTVPSDANQAVASVLLRGLLPQAQARWPSMVALREAMQQAVTQAVAVTPQPHVASRKAVYVVASIAAVASAIVMLVAASRGRQTGVAAQTIDASVVTRADIDAGSAQVHVAIASTDGRAASTPVVATRKNSLNTTLTNGALAGSATATRAVDWHDVVNRATDLLGKDRGADCVAELARAPANTPERGVQEIEFVRLRCTLLDTSCSAGPAVIRAHAQAHNWPAKTVELELHQFDLGKCPLDAPPIERAAERARYRIGLAMGKNQSCTGLVQEITRLGISETSAVRFVNLAASCLARAGDCVGALTEVEKMQVGADLAVKAAVIAKAKDSLLKAYPACQQPNAPAATH